MSDDPRYENDSVKQINRGFVNLTGHVAGNGNGNFYYININHAEQVIYPWAQGDPQSRKNCGTGSSEDKTTLAFGNTTTNGGSNLLSNSSSSPSRDSSNKRTTGEAAKLIACSVCKREYLVVVVPTTTTSTTTAYRCRECHGVISSNSIIPGYNNKQSRENNGRVKLLKQVQQLDNPNTNIGSSSLSRTTITGNKRAVLCGVTYKKRQFKLSGTINDVIKMKDLLVNKFQFPKDSIKVLTEDEKDPNFIPTKRNIMESLKWLVRDCQSGDSLVFYFSGHGLQQPAFDKEDEIDGFDETICPVDFMIEGMITDNEINSTIVRPLKKGVKLHAIIDACHSGTILDLVYVYKKDNGNWKWMVNKAPTSKESVTKSTSGGVAICLSASEDSQMAADTAAFKGKEMNGVMTYLLTKTIREHSGITYAGLLEKVHEEIGEIRRRKYCNGFLKHIFHRKIKQDPLLSSSEKFDVYTRISF